MPKKTASKPAEVGSGKELTWFSGLSEHYLRDCRKSPGECSLIRSIFLAEISDTSNNNSIVDQ